MFEELVALHDPVTRLPGSVLFFDRLRMAQHRAARTNSAVAVLAVELESFKAIARGYGGRTAEEVLRETARRLGAVLRPQDTAAAVGDGGFLIMCDDLHGIAEIADREADEICERVAHVITGSYRVDGTPIDISARIGMCVDVGGSLEALPFIQAALADRPKATPRRTVEFG